MHRPIRPVLPVLVLALLGGCALPHPAPGPASGSAPESSTVAASSASASSSIFAGIDDVDVLVFTDIPDDYAAPRGLRSLAVRERVLARLAAAGIPLRPESEELDMSRPNFRMDIESLQFAPNEHAVWIEVSLGETTRVRRRPELPLMITTWMRDTKMVVRGDDTAPLWREIDRMTDAFIHEYQEANGKLGTDPA